MNNKPNHQLKNIIFNTKSAVLQAWYYILDRSPTDTWQQPALTFITNVLNKSTGTLSNDEINRCASFLCHLTRAIYGKGLDDNLLRGRTIEQEMEHAQTLAEQNEMYVPNITITEQLDLPKQFEQKLNGDIPKELQWGLCAVITCYRNCTSPAIQEVKLEKPILETAVVEQIFPDKWDSDFPNDKNKWTTEKIQKTLQTIGNLILIEPEIHKTTNKIYKGNFLAKRKNPDTGKGYKDSISKDVRPLCNNTRDDEEWAYMSWKNSQDEAVEILKWFFAGFDTNPKIF